MRINTVLENREKFPVSLLGKFCAFLKKKKRRDAPRDRKETKKKKKA